jgi:hypothetical protein
MQPMLRRNLQPQWVHGFIVVPDGRVLIQRLAFGKQVPAPWSASIGKMSYKARDSKQVLGDIIRRRFGIRLTDDIADICLLMSHASSSAFGHVTHVHNVTAVMEIYRIKLLNSITISTTIDCDIVALDFKEVVKHVAQSRYENSSIQAINVADAMGVNF